MGRMKRGEKGHEEAVAKWRATMLEKYGGEEGLHKRAQETGKKGGQSSRGGGGFATNRVLAKIAGAKGGRKSRRGPGGTIETKIEPNRETIIKMYKKGYSTPEIATKLGVSYSVLHKWRKDNDIALDPEEEPWRKY